ncbi:MAG: adenylate/guanylate cyclase domain-containing protein, partial [Cyclobacteriaceae bacterium]
FLQLIRKIGPDNLWPILTGKYHQPQQEERVFMFLDLRSSTYYAEKLGHMKYSLLIQDCFRDLNLMMNKYQLNIYQYLGDGVILTWPLKGDLNVSSCVEIFFHFLQRIDDRKDYYHESYDLLPEFKAGLHSGKVTAAEIGNYRREIAYHGDVVNTASRIQDLCNQYDRNLLVSENLRGQLVSNECYHVDLIDSVKLKGKTKDIKIYAVSNYKVMAKEVGEVA